MCQISLTQRKLDQPGSTRSEADVVLCGVRRLKERTKIRSSQDIAGEGKTWMVHDIEKFGSKLRSMPLSRSF
jgi:transposase-like protein